MNISLHDPRLPGDPCDVEDSLSVASSACADRGPTLRGRLLKSTGLAALGAFGVAASDAVVTSSGKSEAFSGLISAAQAQVNQTYTSNQSGAIGISGSAESDAIVIAPPGSVLEIRGTGGTAVSLGAEDDSLTVSLDGAGDGVDFFGLVDGGAGTDSLFVSASSSGTVSFGESSGMAGVGGFETTSVSLGGANVTLTLRGDVDVSDIDQASGVGVLRRLFDQDESFGSIFAGSGLTVTSRDVLGGGVEVRHEIAEDVTIGVLAGGSASGVRIDSKGILTHRGTIDVKAGADSEGVFSSGENATFEAIGGVVSSEGQGVHLQGGGMISIRSDSRVSAGSGNAVEINRSGGGSVSDSTLVAGTSGYAVKMKSGSLRISGSELRGKSGGVTIGDLGSSSTLGRLEAVSNATIRTENGIAVDFSPATSPSANAVVEAFISQSTLLGNDMALRSQGAGSIALVGSSLHASNAVQGAGISLANGTVVASGSTLNAGRTGIYMAEGGSVGLSEGSTIAAGHANGNGIWIANGGEVAMSGSTVTAGDNGVLISMMAGSVAVADSSIMAKNGQGIEIGSGSVFISGSTIESEGDVGGAFVAMNGDIVVTGGSSIHASSAFALKIGVAGDFYVSGGVTLTGADSVIKSLEDGANYAEVRQASLYSDSGNVVDLGAGDDIFRRMKGVVTEGTIVGGSGSDLFIDLSQAKTIASGSAAGVGGFISADAAFSTQTAFSEADVSSTVSGFESFEGLYASDFDGDITQGADLNLIDRNIHYIDLNGSRYMMRSTTAVDPTLIVNGVLLEEGMLSGVGTLEGGRGDLNIDGPGRLAPGMSVGEIRFAAAETTDEVVLQDLTYEAEINVNAIQSVAGSVPSDRIVVTKGDLRVNDFRVRLVFINDPGVPSGSQPKAKLSDIPIDVNYTATVASWSGDLIGAFSNVETSYDNDDPYSHFDVTATVVGDQLVASFRRSSIASSPHASYAGAPAALMRQQNTAVNDLIRRQSPSARGGVLDSASYQDSWGLEVWSGALYGRGDRKASAGATARGYESDIYGALVGVNGVVPGSSGYMGGYVGYVGGEYDSDDDISEHNYDAAVVGLHGGLDLFESSDFPVSAAGYFSYGWGEVDVKSQRGSNVAKSEYDMRVLATGLSMKIDVVSAKYASLSLVQGLDYERFSRSRPKGDDAAFVSESDNYGELSLSGGLDIGVRLLADERNDGGLIGNASVMWRQRVDRGEFDVNAQTPDSANFTPYDGALHYSLGFETEFSESLSGFAFYEGVSDFDDYVYHSGGGGLRLKF